MSRVFVDTNVLVYRLDADEPQKQHRARALFVDSPHSPVVSTQVLLELFAVITRKLARPLPHAAAGRVIAAVARFPVVPADAALVRRAVSTAGRHQLSIWDAMIIEAAVEAGCAEIWTEDLSAAGSTIRGVQIVNPFLAAS